MLKSNFFKRAVSLAVAAMIAGSAFTAAAAADYLYGDINADGFVNSLDALAAINHSIGKVTYTDEALKRADVNADGEVNANDALLILNYSIGKIETFPAEKEESKIPSTAEEITAYYNDAVNKVIDSKAGFKKNRTTTLNSLEGGSLMNMQIVIDMVNEFLGVGTQTFNNEKGNAGYLSAAALNASDVKNAACTQKDGVYTVTLTLKDGASSATASKTTDTSPIARTGVYCGKGVSSNFDYKNSANIYEVIKSTGEVTVDNVKGTTYNSKIVAKIDSSTGNLISLDVSFDWNATLTKIKYGFVTVKVGKGIVSTSVSLSDIEW